MIKYKIFGKKASDTMSRPTDNPKYSTLQVRITDSTMETIKENADKQDMNVSEYTRQLLDKSLNEENKN